MRIFVVMEDSLIDPAKGSPVVAFTDIEDAVDFKEEQSITRGEDFSIVEINLFRGRPPIRQKGEER